jgi:hypothetical protein
MHVGRYVGEDLGPSEEYSRHLESRESMQNSMRYTQIAERSILETLLHCMPYSADAQWWICGRVPWTIIRVFKTLGIKRKHAELNGACTNP